MGEAGMGLAEAIEQLRGEILEAHRAASPDVRFPIDSVTVELRVVAAREGGGRAGFKVPVVDLELGVEAKTSRERTHTVTVVFGGPVDAAGNPVPVGQDSSERKH